MTSKPSPSGQRPPLRPNPDLYPDLAAAGSLAAALEKVATELGLALGEAVRKDTSLIWAGIASTAANRQPLSINIGSVERWFLFSGWSQGVELIRGASKDLHEVAQIALAWRNGATLHEMRDVSAAVTFTELGEAHERGPAEAVAVKWRLLRDEMQEEIPFEAVRTLVEAAFAEPKLRQLYPFTSHWSLHFTTCTGYPFTWKVPFVDPLRDGRYRVNGPHRGAVIGEADTADEAVAMVVAHLPDDIGPAVAGTANDMAERA
jgi:hypothetical protein